MPDPRAAVEFDNIDSMVVTFEHDASIVFDRTEDGNSAEIGLAVSMSADNEVTLVGDDEIVIGKLLRVGSDGFCSVQIGGGMTLPGGVSATLTVGTRIAGDLGAASAEGFIQTESDAAPPVGRGTIIDSSTATAVVVIL